MLLSMRPNARNPIEMLDNRIDRVHTESRSSGVLDELSKCGSKEDAETCRRTWGEGGGRVLDELSECGSIGDVDTCSGASTINLVATGCLSTEPFMVRIVQVVVGK